MDGRLVRSVVIVGLLCSVAAPVRVQAQSVAVGVRPEGEAGATRGATSVTVDVTNEKLETVLRLISRQAGLKFFSTEKIDARSKLVTMHVRDVPASDALAHALFGTGLKASIVADMVIVMDDRTSVSAAQAQGSVSGRVIDATTRRPLRGATVTIDHNPKETISGEDGGFRLGSIPPGQHTVYVKLLGYTKVSKAVGVTDGQTVNVEIVMEPSVNALDQVVVTGTVVATAQREVPNAMTVITAKDIEQRGITKVDQLFRGDVPGLFSMNVGSQASLDEVTMFSRGVTTFTNVSAGTQNGTNPIKTYVDGIEMADPKFLSQLDPKSIERIEILTGPQASTIYGSNAINGVMQIFTKRGTSPRPQLTLNLLSGWVENNFSTAHTPQHDYSAQVNGVEGRISYNAGGTWNYMGPWTPGKQTTRLGGFGGTRLEFATPAGRVTADATVRRSSTQTLGRGTQSQPRAVYVGEGWYKNSAFLPAGVAPPSTTTLAGQTLGVTLGYAPLPWWSHEFGVGQDVEDTERRSTAPGYFYPDDSALSFEQTHNARRSLNYRTTVQLPLAAVGKATVTAGIDGWQNLTSYFWTLPQTLTGTLSSASYTVRRQPGHNTGAFLQTQIGIRDRLFLTYGLRAEWNPNYGENAEPNYAPRYGIAYTQEVGAITAKLRASYGRSTRPPGPGLKAAVRCSSDPYGCAPFWVPDYGDFDQILASPNLGPEYQQGGEGGLELYFGNRGSLIITRYNQTIDHLIGNVWGDSVRSLVPYPTFGSSSGELDPDGYGYVYQIQYVNLGSLRNQGWELQGSFNAGPFTTRATYSWTKSRVLGVLEKYRAQFAGIDYYQPGATFDYLPEHTWAAGITYAHAQNTIALNVTGTGQIRNYGNDFYYRNLKANIRLPQNRLNMSAQDVVFAYFVDGYALVDLNATHRFSPRVDLILQVQNLTNYYANDYDAWYATLGRQGKIGARVSF